MHVLEAEIVAHAEVAPRYFIMRLVAPQIALSARPGQFIQIRASDNRVHPLLPRPFSVLRCDTNQGAIEILYRAEGVGTHLLTQTRVGQRLKLWGPLGNGFEPAHAAQQIVVGGGVGIPPMLMLVDTQLQTGQWSVSDTKVLLGARTAGEVLCANDFQAHGMGVSLATDDGSWGYHGMVTRLLEIELDNLSVAPAADTQVYACGPHAMLRAVAKLCADHAVACHVCMEAPMPCGLGVCMGCAIATCDDRRTEYARCCREGPVFDARTIAWD